MALRASNIYSLALCRKRLWIPALDHIAIEIFEEMMGGDILKRHECLLILIFGRRHNMLISLMSLTTTYLTLHAYENLKGHHQNNKNKILYL